jgi:hypothetical protein
LHHGEDWTLQSAPEKKDEKMCFELKASEFHKNNSLDKQI